MLVLQGRADEALAVAARMPAGYGRDQRFALAHFARGDVAQGDKVLAGLRDLTTKPASDFDVAVSIAEVHAARKDAEGAFHWLDVGLRRAQAQHGAMAPWVYFDEIQVSPFLASLWSDPRWKQLQPPDGYDK